MHQTYSCSLVFHSHRGFSPVFSMAHDLTNRFNGLSLQLKRKTVENGSRLLIAY